MGPLVLGTEYDSLLQILRDHRIRTDNPTLDRSCKLSVPEIHTHFLFSQSYPRTLDRIEVEDDRVHFGSLSVIGKRAHEIIGLFKVPRKETLWSSDATNELTSVPLPNHNTTEFSRELLSTGTLWITSLGVGLTLCDGLIAKVHLCDPASCPSTGTGPWTKEQQRLSEVRELPAVATAPTKRSLSSLVVPILHLAMFACMGVVIWWGIQVQQRWDAAPDVPGVVVAVDPPPPTVFPDKITLSFNDLNGTERRHTLGHTQFYMTPKLNDEVTIRYLPDAPNEVLGPFGFRDVGFNAAVPYGIGVLAVYSILQLIVLGVPVARARWKK